ncbi:hypothetical protein Taro_038802 [Colocasia esculenta]|uniref:Uncharacterized protein n=1 Tax=Colocasia esculenta TaxID=4460 RepID=A0A843WNA3_COLES|nr:hypothetical protein [Colocasia esculenta]
MRRKVTLRAEAGHAKTPCGWWAPPGCMWAIRGGDYAAARRWVGAGRNTLCDLDYTMTALVRDPAIGYRQEKKKWREVDQPVVSLCSEKPSLGSPKKVQNVLLDLLPPGSWMISTARGCTVPLKDNTTPSTPAGLLLFPGQEGNQFLLQVKKPTFWYKLQCSSARLKPPAWFYTEYCRQAPKGPKGSLRTPHSLFEHDTVYRADHKLPARTSCGLSSSSASKHRALRNMANARVGPCTAPLGLRF